MVDQTDGICSAPDKTELLTQPKTKFIEQLYVTVGTSAE
jgi:hypothetical protein